MAVSQIDDGLSCGQPAKGLSETKAEQGMRVTKRKVEWAKSIGCSNKGHLLLELVSKQCLAQHKCAFLALDPCWCEDTEVLDKEKEVFYPEETKNDG